MLIIWCTYIMCMNSISYSVYYTVCFYILLFSQKRTRSNTLKEVPNLPLYVASPRYNYIKGSSNSTLLITHTHIDLKLILMIMKWFIMTCIHGRLKFNCMK